VLGLIVAVMLSWVHDMGALDLTIATSKYINFNQAETPNLLEDSTVTFLRKATHHNKNKVVCNHVILKNELRASEPSSANRQPLSRPTPYHNSDPLPGRYRPHGSI
jgi:hypothetical protein